MWRCVIETSGGCCGLRAFQTACCPGSGPLGTASRTRHRRTAAPCLNTAAGHRLGTLPLRRGTQAGRRVGTPVVRRTRRGHNARRGAASARLAAANARLTAAHTQIWAETDPTCGRKAPARGFEDAARSRRSRNTAPEEHCRRKNAGWTAAAPSRCLSRIQRLSTRRRQPALHWEPLPKEPVQRMRHLQPMTLETPLAAAHSPPARHLVAAPPIVTGASEGAPPGRRVLGLRCMRLHGRQTPSETSLRPQQGQRVLTGPAHRRRQQQQRLQGVKKTQERVLNLAPKTPPTPLRVLGRTAAAAVLLLLLLLLLLALVPAPSLALALVRIFRHERQRRGLPPMTYRIGWTHAQTA